MHLIASSTAPFATTLPAKNDLHLWDCRRVGLAALPLYSLKRQQTQTSVMLNAAGRVRVCAREALSPYDLRHRLRQCIADRACRTPSDKAFHTSAPRRVSLLPFRVGSALFGSSRSRGTSISGKGGWDAGNDDEARPSTAIPPISRDRLVLESSRRASSSTRHSFP
ncbi:hypothetical protein DCS_05009 [Drechmeria coniospora]|uniref:Uncharacterized protein n=1 Tax=Drechmeria coniospora TaxID=98403 RepID=A0A151GLM7_DRECN|nr:hypothetical protein DCS_05009 [Drechmeria coniospora]KYK57996.1 hypothetical protein DCS_05009 [Drechmeria coniospora]